ncbi:MAG: beta-N-acetylhexosaminidase [Armatimonadetes bacterium]|nr:beta-N-acetylhexosaminidase [Armatimonadota bacterium]
MSTGVPAAALKLVPQPVAVTPGTGVCSVTALRPVLADPADADNQFAASLLRETLTECGLKPAQAGGVPVTLVTSGDGKPGMEMLREVGAVPGPELGSEGYRLVVQPNRIVLAGRSAAGTFYAVQTLRQLIRANRDAGDAIPVLSITDYPAFPHRGFSDDISRGPFPTLDEIKRIIVSAAELKLNCVSWYIEHVFVIPSQPVICPAGIGLSKEKMAELIPFAQRYHVELIGNFQSFGHFWNILKHDEYKDLRETGGILTPAREESYKLLADIFDAMAPSFSSPIFNICCDETYGLGGP